ncbi:putative acyl-CoA thioesterase [Paratrimastix pyriformis]|uniref:Acyl-CoA thioesterase n=1 Tax=Paratrimastix pyriformis TaxID=342808 RepID=A0ABQ8ULH2_9EUKA|nr:putative acyl-CoA thioesterase [Paratrimastix pyriformis]
MEGTAKDVPRPVSASRSELAELMNPAYANIQGNVHGGHILKLIDECCGLCAVRHSRSACVTVSMDSVSFVQPVRIGDVLTLRAELSWVGAKAMEAEVEVYSEKPTTGVRTLTNRAHAVYVAVDENGRPKPVAPLLIETAEQRARFEAGALRQQARLEARAREKARASAPTDPTTTR